MPRSEQKYYIDNHIPLNIVLSLSLISCYPERLKSRSSTLRLTGSEIVKSGSTLTGPGNQHGGQESARLTGCTDWTGKSTWWSGECTADGVH